MRKSFNAAAWWASLLFSLLIANSGWAQTYPVKPIRILTSQPGGAGDIAARLIGPALSISFGQPVVIDNRTNITISGEIVARAPPDGYTLTIYGATLWLGPLLQPAQYDPLKDFAPICLIAQTPSVLVVHPAVMANSVKELIALARAQPGVLNYSSGSVGSLSHLSMELFKSMAQVNIVRIPYKGAGPALNGLAAGETQVMVVNADAALTHIKAGRLKPLAVTSDRPSRLAPNLPTVATSGLPKYESVGMLGMVTRAGAPHAIIERLDREVVRILNQEEIKDKLLRGGMEMVGASPAIFAAGIKKEIARARKLIKDAGLSAD